MIELGLEGHGMVVHAILAVAAAAATPSNAASPAENLLPVDAALAQWDVAGARILALAMPEGTERGAVEGIIPPPNGETDPSLPLKRQF